MGRLFEKIITAVEAERFLVSWHADERAEERGVTIVHLVESTSSLIRERPTSRPNPSVIVRQILADGTEAEVIWAWLGQSGRAKLVTVFFRD